MLEIWTAQYRYPGPYRLDITVKGNDKIGKILAPTWDMVMNHKKGGTDADTIYTNQYINIINRSKQTHPKKWQELLNMQYLVLTCFCPYPNFCHRYQAAQILTSMGAKYHGEITDFSTWQSNKKVINSFRGEYDWLSNFYPVKIYHEDIWYNSNEHFYVAHKFHKDATCEIPNPNNPKEIITVNCRKYAATCKKPKQFGRTAILPPNWNKGLKDEIMSTGLDLKFQNPKLKTNLIKTKGIEIIEGNTWHDNYWGNCTCKKCITKPGQNKLGKMIMTKRDAIL